LTDVVGTNFFETIFVGKASFGRPAIAAGRATAVLVRFIAIFNVIVTLR
jgi:hypothetical protein